jgi:hypothetical protein
MVRPVGTLVMCTVRGVKNSTQTSVEDLFTTVGFAIKDKVNSKNTKPEKMGFIIVIGLIGL